MQSTNFVSNSGESRNPFYEGQFEGETPEQAASRLHWAQVVRETGRSNAHQIEVDRDIKAANLQLLVDKVLVCGAAIEAFEWNENIALEDTLQDAARAAWAVVSELARSLKQ